MVSKVLGAGLWRRRAGPLCCDCELMTAAGDFDTMTVTTFMQAGIGNGRLAASLLRRREWLGAVAGVGAAAAVSPLAADDATSQTPAPNWRTCFNTSCIMGQKLPLPE